METELAPPPEYLSNTHFELFFLKSFFEETRGPLHRIFLKYQEHGRASELEISFLFSSRKRLSFFLMICDTADIGCSDFEPEYITKMLGSESHTMRFIVYPETSIQDALIDRIEWAITIERRDHFTLIDEMKSVIIRES